VRVTRGDNQVDGSEAEVNMKTGIARLLSGGGDRVHGLVIPNDATRQQLNGNQPPPSASK
jgi:lipopolysaccharide export system protein LptA